MDFERNHLLDPKFAHESARHNLRVFKIFCDSDMRLISVCGPLLEQEGDCSEGNRDSIP